MRFSKICIAVIIFSISFSSIFAQELGDEVYKEVTINSVEIPHKADILIESESTGK